MAAAVHKLSEPALRLWQGSKPEKPHQCPSPQRRIIAGNVVMNQLDVTHGASSLSLWAVFFFLCVCKVIEEGATNICYRYNKPAGSYLSGWKNVSDRDLFYLRSQKKSWIFTYKLIDMLTRDDEVPVANVSSASAQFYCICRESRTHADVTLLVLKPQDHPPNEKKHLQLTELMNHMRNYVNSG